MKKLLICSTLLLAGCAATAPQEPLKAGDTFELTGTTKAGLNVQQNYTLRGRPEYDDGDWFYTANGRAINDAVLVLSGDQDVLMLAQPTETPKDQPAGDTWYMICLALPKGPGWASAKGLLLHEREKDMSNLFKALEGEPNLSAFSNLAQKAGTCTVRRL
ncbi:hypothetical protein [Deinococcus multiflagellatus]|uniref:Lipoprotein n=1 Tax=Deinococcus multiflagellatus TaxID=1656887 RepID=A0ABW1ZNQ7_9DEIO|nr:hypothetical protein [Deinococcus multiflagellatus]MBZ9714871.1 hypothetical protein [Deinococcus multiflagellatus]